MDNLKLSDDLKDIDHRLIELAAQDRTDHAAATELSLSLNAVAKRWAKMRRVFGVHSRSAVLAHYYRASLAKVESRLHGKLQLLDQIPTALFGFDRLRSIVYCNRAGADLVGREPHDLFGDTCIWRISTPGAYRRIRIRREFLNSLRDYSDYITEIHRPDGSRVPVKWSSFAHSQPIYPFHWWVMGQVLETE